MTRFHRKELPKVSYEPPVTKFAIVPSRAVTDSRINSRPHLMLLLAAIGIHASPHGVAYPSQMRLGDLCGRSRQWAGKYLRELVKLGYVRRLVPPKYRGKRMAWRLQLLWRTDSPLPPKETDWAHAPWCWREPTTMRPPEG